MKNNRRTYYTKFNIGDIVFLVDRRKGIVDESPYEVTAIEIRDGQTCQFFPAQLDVHYSIRPHGYTLGVINSCVKQDEIFADLREAMDSVARDPNGKENDDPCDWWKE